MYQPDKDWGQGGHGERGMSDAPETHRKGGPLGVEEDAPTHPENGKRLIESVCRQDKDSGRTGAGSLECLPENAQNLAEDEQLPGRAGREEQGTWPPPFSLPPSPLPESHKKRGVEVRQEEELVTMAETGMHSPS